MAKARKSPSASSRTAEASADGDAAAANDGANVASNPDDVRRKLEGLDRQLVELFNERAKLAAALGRAGQNGAKASPGRRQEDELLERAVKRNAGPLADDCVRGLFRELVSGCRALETPLRVAFLGPLYTYSHLAAVHRFGQMVELVPVATIAAVFEEVARGQAEFGIVPMENSTDGRVADTLDAFARSPLANRTTQSPLAKSSTQSPLAICGEVPLRIHHCLLGSGERNDVREVQSKPQALSQCRNWLAKHLPQAKLVEVASTADAAQRAKESKSVAAVASRQAGVNYGLDVLAANIEDVAGNLTRFAVIGNQPAEKTGADKTSLWFEVEHKPGALADAMTIFKKNRLNLTWIESFPLPGEPGRYLFFVELLGHQTELLVRRAIAALKKKSVRLEVLGSYPKMEPVE